MHLTLMVSTCQHVSQLIIHVTTCQALDKLLLAEADPDLPDADGWTPLHVAVHFGQVQFCSSLSESL